MKFTETRLSTWREFRDHSDAMSPEASHEATFLFRGQADSRWELRSSLHRALRTDDVTIALDVEEQLSSEFHSHVLRFARQEDIPRTAIALDRLAWWALMQHHGAPTRLLDWTESPYVAAYFAVASYADTDGAVYALHRQPIEEASQRNASPRFVLDRDAHIRSDSAAPILRTYFPSQQTARFAAQQGVFIYSDHVLTAFEDALGPVYGPAQAEQPNKYLCEKLVIPRDLKREFLVRLRTANITGLTLFPDLDGVGRLAVETARTFSGNR